MDNFQQQLLSYSEDFNARIPEFFPISGRPESRVVEAMKYSVLNGGKRLRPFLLNETGKLFGLNFEETLRPAVSLECLHSYSLIHDDLPAMDNDDLRRGKPTCHKAFDEATAILAGDGLLTYAFEILADNKTQLSEATKIRLISLLANASGAFSGMIAGQMLDLYTERFAEGNADNMIKHIEEMKTGRLIRYACEAGAVLGGADDASTQALISYSRKIGIAFQIADDILDVEGEQALVGKTLNKDLAQGKQTFVAFYGLDKARQLAQTYIDEAKQLLSDKFGASSLTLQAMADFIINRKY